VVADKFQRSGADLHSKKAAFGEVMGLENSPNSGAANDHGAFRECVRNTSRVSSDSILGTVRFQQDQVDFAACTPRTFPARRDSLQRTFLRTSYQRFHHPVAAELFFDTPASSKLRRHLVVARPSQSAGNFCSDVPGDWNPPRPSGRRFVPRSIERRLHVASGGDEHAKIGARRFRNSREDRSPGRIEPATGSRFPAKRQHFHVIHSALPTRNRTTSRFTTDRSGRERIWRICYVAAKSDVSWLH
jgi:hypothetical protein